MRHETCWLTFAFLFYLPSDTILLSIIAELKSVGKTVNEIARTANRFDFINTKYCNRVIERIDVMSDNIREKLITVK